MSLNYSEHVTNIKNSVKSKEKQKHLDMLRDKSVNFLFELMKDGILEWAETDYQTIKYIYGLSHSSISPDTYEEFFMKNINNPVVLYHIVNLCGNYNIYQWTIKLLTSNDEPAHTMYKGKSYYKNKIMSYLLTKSLSTEDLRVIAEKSPEIINGVVSSAVDKMIKVPVNEIDSIISPMNTKRLAEIMLNDPVKYSSLSADIFMIVQEHVAKKALTHKNCTEEIRTKIASNFNVDKSIRMQAFNDGVDFVNLHNICPEMRNDIYYTAITSYLDYKEEDFHLSGADKEKKYMEIMKTSLKILENLINENALNNEIEIDFVNRILNQKHAFADTFSNLCCKCLKQIECHDAIENAFKIKDQKYICSLLDNECVPNRLLKEYSQTMLKCVKWASTKYHTLDFQTTETLKKLINLTALPNEMYMQIGDYVKSLFLLGNKYPASELLRVIAQSKYVPHHSLAKLKKFANDFGYESPCFELMACVNIERQKMIENNKLMSWQTEQTLNKIGDLLYKVFENMNEVSLDNYLSQSNPFKLRETTHLNIYSGDAIKEFVLCEDAWIGRTIIENIAKNHNLSAKAQNLLNQFLQIYNKMNNSIYHSTDKIDFLSLYNEYSNSIKNIKNSINDMSDLYKNFDMIEKYLEISDRISKHFDAEIDKKDIDKNEDIISF